MKLKSYPGYAIEANQNINSINKVQLSYEANWVSVLQNFQSQNAAALRNDSKAALRDNKEEKVLLGVHHERKKPQNNINNNDAFKFNEEWYNFDEFLNPLVNQQQQQSYTKNKANSKIRRSHTVIVKQPTFNAEEEKERKKLVKNDDDLLLLNQRKNLFISRKNFNSDNSSAHGAKEKLKLPINNTNKRYESCFDENAVDENKKKESFYRNTPTTTTPYDDSPFTIKSYEESSRHNNTYNRMRCYETPTVTTAPANNVCVEKLQKQSVENIPLPSKNLLNPLVVGNKLNRFTVENNHHQQHLFSLPPPLPIPPPQENHVGGVEKKDKKNGFGKLFYNTISGSKFQKIFLKQLKSNRSSTENSLLNFDESSASSSSSKSNIFSRSKSDELKLDVNLPETKISSDCDIFAIPRPRLIVPVHTYSRKRRTGNLNHVKKISDDSNKARKGKIKTSKNLKNSDFFRFIKCQMSICLLMIIRLSVCI